MNCWIVSNARKSTGLSWEVKLWDWSDSSSNLWQFAPFPDVRHTQDSGIWRCCQEDEKNHPLHFIGSWQQEGRKSYFHIDIFFLFTTIKEVKNVYVFLYLFSIHFYALIFLFIYCHFSLSFVVVCRRCCRRYDITISSMCALALYINRFNRYCFSGQRTYSHKAYP